MSVLPVDAARRATGSARKSEGFWQSLVLALDQHFVDRTRRAVPAVTVRRSKRDMDRCRRLLRKSATAPRQAGLCRPAQTRPQS